MLERGRGDTEGGRDRGRKREGERGRGGEEKMREMGGGYLESLGHKSLCNEKLLLQAQ